MLSKIRERSAVRRLYIKTAQLCLILFLYRNQVRKVPSTQRCVYVQSSVHSADISKKARMGRKKRKILTTFL